MKLSIPIAVFFSFLFPLTMNAGEIPIDREKERYLEQVVNVDAIHEEGMNPLHWAAFDDEVDVVKFLVSKGAKVNAKDDDGYTPLHYAIFGGSLEVVQFLISIGADIRAKNNKGMTPLHAAVRGGHREIAQFLVENGARRTNVSPRPILRRPKISIFK